MPSHPTTNRRRRDDKKDKARRNGAEEKSHIVTTALHERIERKHGIPQSLHMLAETTDHQETGVKEQE
jgi:hypothetical protein